MFISRNAYDDLRLREAEARSRAEQQASELAALRTTLDWFRLRINQIEVERAQLLLTYTGVKVPVPQVQETQTTQSPADILAKLPHFFDMGDVLARQMHIGHNADGTVNYGAPE